MKMTPTAIPEVLILEPQVYGDDRGFFYESANARRFEQLTGSPMPFAQEYHSRSVKNVLRGMHYQVHQPRGKLMRVLVGAVFDVVVDLRRFMAAGLVPSCRPRTAGRSGCRPASRMALWSPATVPNASIKQAITGRPKTSALYCGTIPRWVSPGPSRRCRCCRARIARAARWLRPNRFRSIYCAINAAVSSDKIHWRDS